MEQYFGSVSFWIVSIAVFLFSVSAHEFAHAWMADRLGDPTPRMYGRLTLNPLKHIDPLGLLAMLFIRIGWAKPVPINPMNFSNPKKDTALVALAGPVMNLLLASGGVFVYGIFLNLHFAPLLMSTFYSFAIINIMLALFNLFPIPPLDGYKFVKLVIPYTWESTLRTYEHMGPWFIILLFWVFDFGKLLVVLTLKVFVFLFKIFGLFIRPLSDSEF